MINWDEVEKKIQSVSIKQTIKENCTLDERKVIDEHIINMRNNIALVQKFFTNISLSSEIASFTFLLNILFITEALGVDINLLIFALMLKGYSDSTLITSSFDGLFYERLIDRLRFLNKYGFEFLSEIIPRELRNDVAHQNFNIESDGTIFITHKKRRGEFTQERLNEVLDNMLRYVKIMQNEFPPEK